jgi:hypothetical protein
MSCDNAAGQQPRDGQDMERKALASAQASYLAIARADVKEPGFSSEDRSDSGGASRNALRFMVHGLKSLRQTKARSIVRAFFTIVAKHVYLSSDFIELQPLKFSVASSEGIDAARPSARAQRPCAIRHRRIASFSEATRYTAATTCKA